MAQSKKQKNETAKQRRRLARKLQGVRTIRTDYYNGKSLIKSTTSVWANNAVKNAVDHLQKNHYDATVVEVYDETDGVLHAVLVRSVSKVGDPVTMKIAFKREVLELM